MRFFDLLKLSLRAFKTRPSRTWLTILGIGLGIGAVLFLVGLGYGMQNLILRQIVTNDALLSLSITSAQPDVIKLDNTAINNVRKVKGVQDVAPLASFAGQVVSGDLVGNVTIKGVSPNYFKYEGITPKAGRLFKSKTKEVVVSEAVPLLFNLKNQNDILGKMIKVNLFVPVKGQLGMQEVKVVNVESEYKIVGIAEGKESVFVYFPLSDLKKYTTIDEYEQAKVRVDKKEDLSPVREALINQGFQVSSLSETINQATKIFRGIQIALGLLGAVALIVTSIGMVNTMTVTLLERTQEIGVMRAIGASKKDMALLFTSEAVVMGFFGGIAGVVIGILGGKLFNFGIDFLARFFGGKPVNLFYFPSWFIITIIIFSIIVGLIAGLFPARRAAKLDPLEALRYK